MNEIARRPDEVRGLSDLAFRELADFVGGIGSIHRGDRGAGLQQHRTRPAHPSGWRTTRSPRACTPGLRGGSALLGRGAGEALARRARAEGRELSTTPRGSALLAAVNGLMGDVLEREESDLQEPMAVRVAGRVVTPAQTRAGQGLPRRHAVPRGLRPRADGDGVRVARSAPRSRAAPTRRGWPRTSAALPSTCATTPAATSPRTGARSSELLEALVESWPVEVERIALVGHSMGGLVARSACHYAGAGEARWAGRVRHVVSLGSPHMGAPLEQLVHLASAGLNVLPGDPSLRRRPPPSQRGHPRPAPGLAGGRGLARLRSRRPARGCRDRGAAARGRHPLLRGRHASRAAPATRSGGCWATRWCSRRAPQGAGGTGSIPFEAENGMHVGGTHHLALLNHPEVYERLRAWLG